MYFSTDGFLVLEDDKERADWIDNIEQEVEENKEKCEKLKKNIGWLTKVVKAIEGDQGRVRIYRFQEEDETKGDDDEANFAHVLLRDTKFMGFQLTLGNFTNIKDVNNSYCFVNAQKHLITRVREIKSPYKDIVTEVDTGRIYVEPKPAE